jgi:hypothetical protein
MPVLPIFPLTFIAKSTLKTYVATPPHFAVLGPSTGDFKLISQDCEKAVFGVSHW